MAVYEYEGDPAPAEDPKAKKGAKDEGRTWGDYGRAFVSGTAKTVSGAMQFLEPDDATPSYKQTRRAIDTFGDQVAEGMSPQAKKDMNRRLFDPSEDGLMSNPGAIPLQLTGSVAPSLVITGGVGGVAGLAGKAAGSLAGVASAGQKVGGALGVFGAGAAMGGGDVVQSIGEEINKATPEQLGASDPNSRYAQLRQTMSDQDARDALTREAADGYAQGYAVFSGVLNSFGPVGGALRRMATGQGVRTIARGAAKRTLGKEVGKEAVNEYVDESAGDLAAQSALRDKFGRPIDPMQNIEAGGKGALFGGLTGGGTHIIAGGGHERVTDNRAQSIPDDAQQALNSRNNVVPTPTDPASTATTGAQADTILENARTLVQSQQQATQTEMGAVNPEVNGQAPAPRSAIPEFDPMQERRQQWLGGPNEPTGPSAPPRGGYPASAPAPTGQTTGIEPSTPGPLPTQDPFADRRDAMRPGPAQPQPQRQSAEFTQNLEFLQKFADTNGGVIDPTQIAAFLSNGMGRRVDAAEVMNEIAPYVQQGYLQQSSRPGMRGTPTFTMATERQGPAAQPGYQPQRVSDSYAMRRPDTTQPPTDLFNQQGELFGGRDLGRAPPAQQGDMFGGEQLTDERPGVGSGQMDLPLQARRAPSAAAPAPAPVVTKKAGAARTAKGGTVPSRAAAPEATNAQPARPTQAQPRPQAKVPADAKVKIKGGTPQARAEARSGIAEALERFLPSKPASEPRKAAATPSKAAPKAAAPKAEKLKAKVKAKTEAKPKAAPAKAEPAAAPTPAPAPAKAEAKPAPKKADKLKKKAQEKIAPGTPRSEPLPRAPQPKVETKPEEGMIYARDNTDERRPVKSQPRPEPAKVPARMSADQAKDRALAAAPRDADGKANVGVISGVMRMVYNKGLPKGAGQSVTFGTDWYDELSAKDRRDVVAILEGWRQAYGKQLDGKRPLVTWLRSDEGVEQKASSDLDRLASKFKVTRKGKSVQAPANAAPEVEQEQVPYLVSDKTLVDGLKREFQKDIKKGDGDIDALVASIMKQAKDEMEKDGFPSLDFPQLLTKAKENVANAQGNPRLISSLKQAFNDVAKSGREGGNLIERAIDAQIVGPLRSEAFGDANAPIDRLMAKVSISDPIRKERDELIAAYKALPSTKETAERKALDERIVAFNKARGASDEFQTLWQKERDDTATPQEKDRIAAIAPADAILPDRLKIDAARTERTLENANVQELPENRLGRATDARLEFFTFVDEDGSLRKRDTVKRNINRLLDSYQKAGEPVPEPVRVIASWANYARQGRLSAQQQKVFDALKSAAEQAAKTWDAVAEARLYDARSKVIAATPQGVFAEFAPKAGDKPETLQEAGGRLTAMAKEFVKRQQSFRNAGGAMNVLNNTADPHTKFMKTLLDLVYGKTERVFAEGETQGRGKDTNAYPKITDLSRVEPLVIETDAEARRNASQGDLSDEEQDTFNQRVARAEKRRGRVLTEEERSKLLSTLRKGRKGVWGEHMLSRIGGIRETQEWKDYRANLEREELRSWDDALLSAPKGKVKILQKARENARKDAAERLDKAADKLYREKHTITFKDTLQGASGLKRQIEARVRRAQIARSLLAEDFDLRIGNEIDGDALGKILGDANPFAVYRTSEPFGEAAQPTELDFGSHTWRDALQAVFPYGVTDNVYGPLADINAGLERNLDTTNVKVVVMPENEYRKLPAAKESYVGHFDPATNTVYMMGGRDAVGTMETLRHELIHAVTIWGLRHPEVKPLAKALLDAAQGLRGKIDDYVLSSADELVAYGMTNDIAKAKFGAEALSDEAADALGLPRNSSSLWNGFVNLVRKVLGLAPTKPNSTLLDAVMLVGNRAADVQRGGYRPSTDPSDLVSPGRVDLREELAKRRTNLSPKGTKAFLDVSTMTDMVRDYGKLFSWAGNGVRKYLQLSRQRGPLEQYENAAAYEASTRQQLEQNLQPFLEQIANLSRTNPELSGRVSALLVDAANDNIDLTSATPPGRYATENDPTSVMKRQAHAELHRRYQALPPEAKAIVDGVRDTLRERNEALLRAMAKSVLMSRWQQAQLDRKNAGDPLPAGYPDEANAASVDPVVERIVNDQMTEADLQWVGEKSAVLMKQWMRELTRDGFRLPAYRFGEWVVYGKRTDFEAKTEVNSDAEAIALANRIRGVGGHVKRIYKRTYDPQGARVAYENRGRRQDLTEKWVVEAEPYVYEAFESKWDAEQRRKEMLAGGNVELREVEPRESALRSYLEALDPKQNEMLTKAIRDMTADPDKQKELLSAFRDVSAQLMPGATLRHSMIKRRNVMGASQDLFRTMAKYVDASARYEASMEFEPYKMAALQAMQDEHRRLDDGSNTQRLLVMDELKNRSAIGKNSEGGPWGRALQRTSSVWYLASASYSMIQLLQPYMMGVPVIAKLHLRSSLTDIAGAMKQAHDDIGGFGHVAGAGAQNFRRVIAKWRRQATEGPVNLIERLKTQVNESGARDAAEVADLLDELAKRGRIDEHAGLEVARDIKTEGNWLARNFRMIEDMSRAFPTAAESYNRAVVALAAYRLAIKNGETREVAFFKAEQAIIDSQFVYNPHNTPAFFTKAQNMPGIFGFMASSFLTFKKFVQAMYMQLGRSLYDSVRGETPEIRKAAFRQFSLMLATHGAMAGALGLPLEPIKFALGAVALLFGENDPWDIDEAVIKKTTELFGKEAAEAITKGLPRLINLDLSQRVGLEGMLFFKELKDFKKETFMQYIGEMMLGPQGGIGWGVADGLKTIRDGGSPMRAVEQMSPKALRDGLAAWRWASEGQTNLRGDPVDEGMVGKGDAIWKALGFNSGTVANIQAHRSYETKQKNRLKLERSALHRQMIKAQDAKDDAEIARVQGKIDAFNEEHPDNGITDKTVSASRAQRERSKGENSYFGMPLRKGQTGTSIYNLPDKGYTETTPKPRAALPAPTVTTTAWSPRREEPVFAAIIRAEGTARDGDPYNEVLGYGAYGTPPKPLTQMTLAEVYDFGLQMRRAQAARGVRWDRTSSASGAFQIVGSTMKQHMAEAGLDWNDKFTPENQRKLARIILAREGLGAWAGFKVNRTALDDARRALRGYA